MASKALIAALCVFALHLCHSFPLDSKALLYLQSNSTGAPANAQYTYSQSSGRFQGKAYDGGYIDVTGCSGAQGSCRNNPSCQCKPNIGPLPRATCVPTPSQPSPNHQNSRVGLRLAPPPPFPHTHTLFAAALTYSRSYTIGPEIVFKGMPSCYELYPDSGDMCGRSGFLIHGGDCGYNPSEGCIVISDAGTRHRIQHGTAPPPQLQNRIPLGI